MYHPLKLARGVLLYGAIVSGVFFACQQFDPFLWPKPALKIVYLGFANQPELPDELNCQVLGELIREANRRHPEWPFRLQLERRVCDFSGTTTDFYRQIDASAANIGCVLDFTWGKHLLQSEPIIREKNIPVIAISADQNEWYIRETQGVERPFGHNAVFLYPSDPQPAYLSQFARQVLSPPAGGFCYIAEEGYKLDTLFRREFATRGLFASCVITLDPSQNKTSTGGGELSPPARKALENALGNGQRFFVLNAHSTLGDPVLEFLSEKSKSLDTIHVLGMSQVTRKNPEDLAALTDNGSRLTFVVPEHDNNSLETPLPADMHAFLQAFKRRHSGETMLTNKRLRQNFVRCHSALHVAERAFDDVFHEQKAQPGRPKMAAYFRQLRGHRLTAGDKLFKFDAGGILITVPTFKFYRGGKVSVSPYQINETGEKIPCLVVGVDVLDISNIDIDKDQVNYDLIYWEQYPQSLWPMLRARDLKVAGPVDTAGSADKRRHSLLGFNTIEQQEQQWQSLQDKIFREPVTQTVMELHAHRANGRFLNSYTTFDFPFDDQLLRIPLTALNDSRRLHVAFDYSHLQGKIDYYGERLPFQNLENWEPDSLYVTLDNKLYPVLEGVEEVLAPDADKYEQSLEQYKQFSINLPIHRKNFVAWVLIIIPLVIFSLLTSFVLFSHLVKFEKLGDLMIAVLLGAVAYSINLVQVAPHPDSPNRAYLFLLATLCAIAFCFIYLIRHDRRDEKRRQIALTATTESTGKPYVFLWVRQPQNRFGLLMLLFYLVASIGIFVLPAAGSIVALAAFFVCSAVFLQRG